MLREKNVKILLLMFIIGVLVIDMTRQAHNQSWGIMNNEKQTTQTQITLTGGNLDQIVPIDEDAIADERYRDTPQEAIEAVQTLAPLEQVYRWKVDEVIFQKESDEYALILYRAIRDKNMHCTTLVKLKKKYFNETVKYAVLSWNPYEYGRHIIVAGGFRSYVQNHLDLMDMGRDMGIEPEKKRFLWGISAFDDIYKLRIEGQAPTEIIPYVEFDQQFYFWYYDDIQSDKPFSQMEFTVE